MILLHAIFVSNRFKVLLYTENFENKWVNFKTAVTKAAEIAKGTNNLTV